MCIMYSRRMAVMNLVPVPVPHWVNFIASTAAISPCASGYTVFLMLLFAHATKTANVIVVVIMTNCAVKARFLESLSEQQRKSTLL